MHANSVKSLHRERKLSPSFSSSFSSISFLSSYHENEAHYHGQDDLDS
ncbi:hypothetical protein CSUI_008924 [Cystoisospora suis]|uniref:Uncharacterized protein n=1 Tax=Cystoisospora suis TaxID=483139 RepID=A0A2C6KI76_9APIC|nr:hypothetical protein CSUI_008924 [Cystoisospora suis]